MIVSFVVWLLQLLPLGDLPVLITTGWRYFVNVLWSFDWLIPTRTLLTLFILSISAELAIWLFDIGHWIYVKLRHG